MNVLPRVINDIKGKHLKAQLIERDINDAAHYIEHILLLFYHFFIF